MPQPSLEQVPVNEAMCQRRTGEIIDRLIRIELKVDKHTAWHNGQEAAQKKAASRAAVWGRWAAVIVALATAFGGAVWLVANQLAGA